MVSDPKTRYNAMHALGAYIWLSMKSTGVWTAALQSRTCLANIVQVEVVDNILALVGRGSPVNACGRVLAPFAQLLNDIQGHDAATYDHLHSNNKALSLAAPRLLYSRGQVHLPCLW